MENQDNIHLSKKKVTWLAMFLISVFAVVILAVSQFEAARAQGVLDVEIVAGYNLVVDSNVTSPSTYGPRVATVMGRFCNTGDADLTNVKGYIGDYDAGTPGIYPDRDSTDPTFISQHPELEDSGVYSFSHMISVSDATRKMLTLSPGECKVQYWHITYPACENSEEPPCSEDPVWGASNDPTDDLWLEFDVWGTSSESINGNASWTMTMRNEISAMANKIEPNPDGYWFSQRADGVLPGETTTSNGILYTLGNVNQGFDNDGDFVPDYNAWLQPISDPGFDASCFRLIKTSGVLTVTRSSGNPPMYIYFEDQLYFTNLPHDNTDVTGKVIYEFLALGGSCSASMTPYQEAASGYDNEKFNGDFGAGIPGLRTAESSLTLNKSSDPEFVSGGGEIDYTIPFQNTDDDYGIGRLTISTGDVTDPLIISDTVPVGLAYKSGSADYTFDQAGDTATIYFSTDGGSTWDTTDPTGNPTSTLGSEVIIQWWLDQTLGPNETGEATFTAIVPGSPTENFIENCADARALVDADGFVKACAVTIVEGTLTIGDFVWRDLDVDGEQDGGDETGIGNVDVWLYWDRNNNDELDDEDLLIYTETTAATATVGYYQFDNLPAGEYLVVVDESDVASQIVGFRHTTDTIIPVTLTTTSVDTADFGFGPSLDLIKTFVGGSAYEGEEVNYTILVENLRPGGGEYVGTNACRFYTYATQEGSLTIGQNANKDWANDTNALGAAGPDNNYATSDYTNALNQFAGTGYNIRPQDGNITSVEAIFSIFVDGILIDDDAAASLYYGGSLLATTEFTSTQLNGYGSGPDYQDYLVWDVDNTDDTQDPGGDGWDWDDFAGDLQMRFDSTKDGGIDGGIIYFDVMGFRVEMDQPCPVMDSDDIILTVPLTDTFDTSLLEYVSSVPPASEVNTVTGVISWTDIGPLYPASFKSVNVTFTALEPVTSPATAYNTAGVKDAKFADNTNANDDDDDASGTIYATGEITGTVWSDAVSDAWNTPTGHGSGDFRIPNVTINLYACYDDTEENGGVLVNEDNVKEDKTCEAQNNNNGEWRLIQTTVTDGNGNYEFVALRDAYYYVEVDSSTLPGGSQTQSHEAGFDANGDGFSCSAPEGNNSCDDIWSNPSYKLYDKQTGTVHNPINNAETITNVNFGYDMEAAIFGYVWQDHDGDGIQDAGDNGLDNGLDGITVTLWTGGSVYTTTQTDSSGYYEFTGLGAGTYTITVDTGTLPTTLYTSDWTQTYDPDATCVPTPALGCDDEHTVTISYGEISGSHDFGYHETGTVAISGTVYVDWDGDGDQDLASGTGLEEGIGDVTVYLYEDVDGDGSIDPGTDALISTTVTISSTNLDIHGDYSFSNLPAGNYLVVVDETDDDLPSTYAQREDPDEDGVCTICDGDGRVDATGGSVTEVDFGYQPTGFSTIGDFVWKDDDGDGYYDLNETGIMSITVYLYEDSNGDGQVDSGDALVATTVTSDGSDGNPVGYYLFSRIPTDLPAGDFLVRVDTNDPDLPVDGYGNKYVLSTGNDPHVVDLGQSDHYLDADFGFTAGGSIGDFIWQDNNGDGTPSGDEPGIANVTVWLCEGEGGTCDETTAAYTATTNASGIYTFTGLAAYTYTVQIDTSTLPTGFSQTYDPDEPDGYLPCVTCDHKDIVVLPAGQIDLSSDFGYQPPGVIGDRVWLDMDGDGVQDPEDLGIAGVVVIVTNGTVTYTTITDSDGLYGFGNLGNDTWTITFEQPDDMTTTTIDNTAVANGVGSVGATATVVISGGSVTSINGNSCTDCDLYVDSGFKLDGTNSIAGTVYYDTNDNATQEITETLTYTDVTIFLWERTGCGVDGSCGTSDDTYKLLSQLDTDANGDYLFDNLPDGYYAVSVNEDAPNLDGLSPTQTGSPTTYYRDLDLSAGNTDLTDQDFGFISFLDMGDLPVSFYTKLNLDGPRHTISSSLYLGGAAQPDNEPDGQPDAFALGDDNDGNDDDDGFATGTTEEGSWIAAQDVTLVLNVNEGVGADGYLVGWFDWNYDGSFGSGEKIEFGSVDDGLNSFNLTLPGSFDRDKALNIRFRLYDGDPGAPAATGFGGVGEVEDYQLTFTPTGVTLDEFRASLGVDGIQLNWVTVLEIDTLGFHLYRSTSIDGEWVRLNGEMIPSQAFNSPGIRTYYAFLDEAVESGVTYYYWLEMIDPVYSDVIGPVTAIGPYHLYLPSLSTGK